jgi:endonuclease/exonuclease/phosphatase family metal-dependent hydrolase
MKSTTKRKNLTQPSESGEGPPIRRHMTRRRESRKEPELLTHLLSCRKTARLGCWNVRTMWEQGRTAQVLTEMRNYRIDILGISETRWKGTEKKRLNTGEMMLSSGQKEGSKHYSKGVALVLSKEAQKALIEWEAMGPRIISATFRTTKKKIKLHVIQCYAPTNDKEESKKEKFYTKLQSIVEKKRKRDIIIMMGDLNAKVGEDNSSFEEVMGKHGLGKMNENGEILANFCASNQLVIGGSIFQHKRIHKATWISPDHKTENQIDHICINKKFRTSLQDVKVCRGADVASDHHLLLSNIKMKLKRYTTSQKCRHQYKIEELKNQETKVQFAVSVANKYQILQQVEDSMDIEVHWQQIKNIWKETCTEVLGDKARQNKEWITTNTLNKIKERKNKKAELNRCKTRSAKAKAHETYQEVNKEVKRNIRSDKRKYIEDLAREAEEAAGKGNMRDLYNITRKLTGKYKQSSGLIKDKDGKVISNTKEQMKRWKEHFEELLNRPKPQVQPDIEPADEEIQVNCERPSKEEIKNAIKLLKDRKAAGPDGIPAEAIKADKDISTELLYKLLGKIWEKEEIPTDWKEGYLVKLPKKGDLQECTNYRGIMLLSVPGKILSRIILERLKEGIDKQLREEQAGFRKNRSCTDQIATLRIIVEQSLEWNSSLYIGFVDYEKAFDSLD